MKYPSAQSVISSAPAHVADVIARLGKERGMVALLRMQATWERVDQRVARAYAMAIAQIVENAD